MTSFPCCRRPGPLDHDRGEAHRRAQRGRGHNTVSEPTCYARPGLYAPSNPEEGGASESPRKPPNARAKRMGRAQDTHRMRLGCATRKDLAKRRWVWHNHLGETHEGGTEKGWTVTQTGYSERMEMALPGPLGHEEYERPPSNRKPRPLRPFEPDTNRDRGPQE